MEITRDNLDRLVVTFEKTYDYIIVPLPNGAKLEIGAGDRGGVFLRGIPNRGLGTVRVYPCSGNVVEVTVDER